MYALYNKEKSAFLEHPVVGLWLSPDIKEARSMQQAAQVYLRDLKLDHLVDRIVVIDYTTKEEISNPNPPTPPVGDNSSTDSLRVVPEHCPDGP